MTFHTWATVANEERAAIVVRVLKRQRDFQYVSIPFDSEGVDALTQHTAARRRHPLVVGVWGEPSNP